MKRLIVDMDDVLADATGQFINHYEKEFGVRVERESLNYKTEGTGWPGNHDAVYSFTFREKFFRTMEVKEDAPAVLKKLRQEKHCAWRLHD